MITQALSYRPVDQATPPGPRTGKGGLRPVDSLHLIDARRRRLPGNMQAATVSQLDVATAQRTGTFSVPGTPEAITVSRDGTEVWVGSNDEGLVSVVETESGDVSSPLSGFEWPYRILIVEDRDLVVIPEMGRHVVRFVDYSDRTDIETLGFPGEGPQGVALTRDQGTVFLSLSRSGEIAVIDSRRGGLSGASIRGRPQTASRGRPSSFRTEEMQRHQKGLPANEPGGSRTQEIPETGRIFGSLKGTPGSTPFSRTVELRY